MTSRFSSGVRLPLEKSRHRPAGRSASPRRCACGSTPSDLRGVAAARHRAARAGEVVAGRAVGQEDLAAADDRLLALLVGQALEAVVGLVGDRRAGRRARRRTPRAPRSRRRCRPRACVGAWAPGWAIGIRPVPTWKSTAAAPTPTSDGPSWLPSSVGMPSPFWPWQEAQPTRNSSRPLRDLVGRRSWPSRPARGREGGVQAAGQQQAEQQHQRARRAGRRRCRERPSRAERFRRRTVMSLRSVVRLGAT